MIDTKQYLDKINSVTNQSELETVRIELLGRSGLINKLFSDIKNQPNPKEYGQELNTLKNKLEELINNKTSTLVETPRRDVSTDERDSSITLSKLGHLHPVTVTERQLNEVFRKLGFSIYASPEIVTDEYNFQRLNVPENHPARDMQDSIYIHQPEFLLRTQSKQKYGISIFSITNIKFSSPFYFLDTT